MDPIITAAIIAGVIALITTGITSETQKKTDEKNREQAEAENIIMREREDTAHQREMEDYKNAGINPLMAASTAGAGSASGQIIPFMGSGNQMTGLFEGLTSDIIGGAKSISEKDKTKQETTLLEIDTELREDEKRELLKTLGQLNWEYYNEGEWEELGNDMKKEWNNAAGNITVQGWRIQNETDIINAQKWMQNYLAKEAEINTELARQLKEMNDLDLGIKNIMLKMTKKDWEIIKLLGPDKAWERISLVINGLVSFAGRR